MTGFRHRDSTDRDPAHPGVQTTREKRTSTEIVADAHGDPAAAESRTEMQ